MTEETHLASERQPAEDQLATRESAQSTAEMSLPARGEQAQEQNPNEYPFVSLIGVREEILNERLGDIVQKDHRFQHWTGSVRRKHNRRHAIRLAVWAEEALRRPGYIEEKLESAGVTIASNSKSLERSIYAGVVRLGSADAARKDNGDPMLPHVISRIAYTMAGVSAFCRNHGLQLAFGNEQKIYEEIGDLSDQELQKLADAVPPFANDEIHPLVEGPDSHVSGPVVSGEVSKGEQGGAAAASGRIPKESEASGDAATRQDIDNVEAPSSEAEGVPARGIRYDDLAIAEATELLVRKFLPLFGQLSICSDATILPAGVTLFVALTRNSGCDIPIYGPLKSGTAAAKAVMVLMAKYRISNKLTT